MTKYTLVFLFLSLLFSADLMQLIQKCGDQVPFFSLQWWCLVDRICIDRNRKNPCGPHANNKRIMTWWTCTLCTYEYVHTNDVGDKHMWWRGRERESVKCAENARRREEKKMMNHNSGSISFHGVLQFMLKYTFARMVWISHRIPHGEHKHTHTMYESRCNVYLIRALQRSAKCESRADHMPSMQRRNRCGHRLWLLRLLIVTANSTVPLPPDSESWTNKKIIMIKNVL